MTKAWKAIKHAGRAALAGSAVDAFDAIAKACAIRGFFINPIGELESMLTDYGIQPTTDKRAWIAQALRVVPSLEPDDSKYPWKFLKELHDHLQTVEESCIRPRVTPPPTDQP
jgi:hypothetical protein